METFEEQCHFGLYTLEYHSVDRMVGKNKDFKRYLFCNVAHTSILLYMSGTHIKNFAKKTEENDGNRKRHEQKILENVVMENEGG